jgi:hypothetical protein
MTLHEAHPTGICHLDAMTAEQITLDLPGESRARTGLLLGLLRGGSWRGLAFDGSSNTPAFTRTRDVGVGDADWIFLVAYPRTLRIGYTRPATPVNAGIEDAVVVFFTLHAIPCVTGPEWGAAISVAKPIAALVILRASAVRHVFGPGSLRTIIEDGLVERRELDPPIFLKIIGARRLAVHGRR